MGENREDEMAAGRSGYVDFTASSFGGSQTLRVNWSETYDQSANTSNVTITSLQLKSNTWVGQAYYGNMVIKINGTTAITLTESNNSAFLNNFDTFATVNNSGSTITGSVNNIPHNADGTKMVSISIAANSYTNPIFWSADPGQINFTAGSQNITLTSIPRQYTLSISQGTGSAITVKRGATTLSNGATITYGDVLTITFAANTGYTLGAHTVNGSTFTSGGTHTVTGNVTVVSSASLQTFALSINAGTGSSIMVKRGSATIANVNGSTYNGTVTYGDVLTITFMTSSGYTIGTHTVNGTAFTSGGTHTVSGAVTIISTASVTTGTLSITQGANTTITVQRGGTTLSNGATLNVGDVLTITITAAAGYTLTTSTVNGQGFTSGGTYTAQGNVAVVSAASANPYSLTINQGNNTIVTVMRGTQQLQSGAVVATGDKLTITFEAATGYAISTHTVNGVTFTSGDIYTVSGAVMVVSSAVTAGRLTEPTDVSPDEVNGTGSVDVSQGITVSWHVNGNVSMTAYQIVIYENNAASTQLYSTGRIALAEPFWGRDYTGEVQDFTATISAGALSGAGITNGNEYKLLITQWWNDSSSIVQNTASVFVTRGTPTLTVSYESNDGTDYTFAAEYVQAQGAPLNWVRWQIFAGSSSGTEVYDSGVIAGTGELKLIYDGMAPGQTYIIQCTVETVEGVQVSGTLAYQINYDTGYPFAGGVTVCPAGEIGVRVSWTAQTYAQRYAVHRLESGSAVAWKVADVNAATLSIVDYAAASATTYRYLVYPINSEGTVLEPGSSESFAIQYTAWAIVEAQKTGEKRYAMLNAYRFRMGKGGVNEGGFSNNNSPNLLQNFTPYPLRQAASSNYLTGSVSGYIGSVTGTKNYADSVAQARELMALSNTENPLFLLDPKGHFLQIQTAAPVSSTTEVKSAVMPQTVTISWAETGEAEGLSIWNPRTNLLAEAQLSAGYLNANGVFVPSSSNVRTTSAISVTPGFGITASMTEPVEVEEDIDIFPDSFVLCFYDGGGNMISRLEETGLPFDGELLTIDTIVPDGAVTARFYWAFYQYATVSASLISSLNEDGAYSSYVVPAIDSAEIAAKYAAMAQQIAAALNAGIASLNARVDALEGRDGSGSYTTPYIDANNILVFP